METYSCHLSGPALLPELRLSVLAFSSQRSCGQSVCVSKRLLSGVWPRFSTTTMGSKKFRNTVCLARELPRLRSRNVTFLILWGLRTQRNAHVNAEGLNLRLPFAPIYNYGQRVALASTRTRWPFLIPYRAVPRWHCTMAKTKRGVEGLKDPGYNYYARTRTQDE